MDPAEPARVHHDSGTASPQLGTSPTATDIEAVAAVTSQAFSANFSQSTADDIRALTEALTTPADQTPAEQQATAAASSPGTPISSTVSEATVAAVAANVAAVSAVFAEQLMSDSAQSQKDSKAELGQRLEGGLGHGQEGPGGDAGRKSAQALTDMEAQEQRPRGHTEDASKDSSIKSDMTEAKGSVVGSDYSHVLTLNTDGQKPSGKRSAQEAFEQDEAARALQLIALSLSNPSTASGVLAASSSPPSTLHDSTAISEALPVGQAAVEKIIQDHDTAASVTDTLMSISRAISFPTASAPQSSIAADTEAFTRAVISATQHEVDRNKSENSGERGGLDHTALESLSLQHHTPSHDSVTAPSTSSQGFTFEIDESTGKAQVKWTPDPRDEEANAKALQHALAAIIANTGIAGLSDLTGSNSGLLAPPLGQFPVQGSEFGSVQDTVKTEPTPAPRKKRKPVASTSKSAGQNTAASIPDGAPSFPCDFPGCDKVFARLYNLKSHSRTHTDERPFACSHCQLAFARNHDLKRHVKIHGGDKTFLCSGCGKSFSRLDALRRHRANSKNRPGCEATPPETGAA